MVAGFCDINFLLYLKKRQVRNMLFIFFIFFVESTKNTISESSRFCKTLSTLTATISQGQKGNKSGSLRFTAQRKRQLTPKVTKLSPGKRLSELQRKLRHICFLASRYSRSVKLPPGKYIKLKNESLAK